MKTTPILMLTVALLVFPVTALAEGGAPWDFEYTARGITGTGTPISDDTVAWYFLDLAPGSDVSEAVRYMELEITGLTHEAPADLNLILINPLDPSGIGVELMDDRGDQHAISNVDLVFSTEKFTSQVLSDDPIASGMYLPETGSFQQYFGSPPTIESWILVVIDDSPGQTGSFMDVSLRGNIVPEPMTLTLLALGALATFRRRRR